MCESSYWDRFWRRKVSRRRLLRGAALGAGGLAAAALVGCQEEAAGPPPPQPTVGPGGIPSIPSGLYFTPTPAPEGSRGGMIRFFGYDALVFDTLDPHQTQFGPTYNGHSSVFSKILMYLSHDTLEKAPDLAQSMPEVVDEVTYVVKLRPGVKFHDTPEIRQNFPQVAGRELTAEDVKFSWERQKSRGEIVNPQKPRAILYYRSSQYEVIDKIEVVDKYTLRVTLKEPNVAFLHYLADSNAFIVAKELVDAAKDEMGEPRRMVGTGPFMWGELVPLNRMVMRRNPNWFGWGQPELGRPWVDGWTSFFFADYATHEAQFRQKRVDVLGSTEDADQVVKLKEAIPELNISQDPPISGWVNSRLKVYCAPFNDWRVRRALHLAIDRQLMLQGMFRGHGVLQPPVGRAISRWALPEDELARIPGYRVGAEREADLREARQLYDAAGRPPIRFAVADIPTYIPSYAGQLVVQLKRVFGDDADIRQEPRTPLNYVQIAQGLLRGCEEIPMTVAYDNGWIDLDDWVYPYFHSRGAKNSFWEQPPGTSPFDPELDRLLEAQRRETKEEKRRELGFQIQRYLLGMDLKTPGKVASPDELAKRKAVHARLDYIAPQGITVWWPYLKNRTAWPWFGNAHWFAIVWLDRTHPSFQGRPS